MSKPQTSQHTLLDNFRDFLEQHPDIFEQYPELLSTLRFTDKRGAASLLERQIAVLQQQLKEDKQQHQLFVDIARENESINDNFTHIVCRLIAYKNLSEFASEFPLELKRTFNIDEVSFKTRQGVQRKPSDQDAYESALRRVAGKRAVCDNKFPSSVMSLFFSDAVRSAALIPLVTDDSKIPLGVLALGSTDEQRYTHDLGTAHIDKLGKMAGLCLARLQPS